MKCLCRLPAVAALIVTFSAPAMAGSPTIRAHTITEKFESGIAYFLPRQLAQVTVSRADSTLDKAIESAGAAELAQSIAKASFGAAKRAVTETEDQIAADGGDPIVRKILLARLEAQTDALAKARSGVDEATTAVNLARAMIRDAASSPVGASESGSTRVEIKLLSPMADPRFAFRLRPRHTIFRDDEHKLVVSSGGLLTSVDIVSADRTADILVELATLAGAAATGFRRAKEIPCNLSPDTIVTIVDFADASEVDLLNKSVECLKVRFKADQPAAATWSPLPSVPASVDGIVYRTPIDVLVHIQRCVVKRDECLREVESDYRPSEMVALSLPQAGPISYVRQDAGFMTTTKYKLAFKDGVLVSYDATRPSELLEVARTPMRMINGFFDGASKIVSIRTGQNNAQATLVQSDTALQTARLNSQTTVSAAELAASQAILRDQSKRDAMNRCIGERVTRGEPYDSCFTGL